MANYIGNDTLNTFTLAESGIGDVAWSPDETRLYAATNGKIKVFDVASHTLLATWNVGKSLQAIDISDDGKTLVASGYTAQDAIAVYSVDTVTGTKTTYTDSRFDFGDVTFAGNTHVLKNGHSDNGSSVIYSLDLATKVATMVSDAGFYPNPHAPVQIRQGHLTLLADRNVSSGPLFIYDDRTGTITAAGDDYQPGAVIGFNFGPLAISEQAGLVLQMIYDGHLNVYDLDLKIIKNLGLGNIAGFTFDKTGENLIVHNSDKYGVGEIQKYRLSDWKIVESYQVPSANQIVHDGLKVSEDGYVLVTLSHDGGFNPSGKLTLIDTTSRNELFKGTAGADTFAGGFGDDTYRVNSTGDVVNENALSGTDTVLASVTHTLTSNVEQLQLTGSSNIDGVGNAGDNTLIGNAGINHLDGRAGNDTYILTDARDAVAESDARGGIDTVRASISYSLGENIENLFLAGRAVSGTGNALANTITGNSLANTLDGGLGNDTLIGGASADNLMGGAGNDTLDGGTGADTMTGGLGNDTYIVDTKKDVVDEVAAGGKDTIIASFSIAKLQDTIENLELANGAGAINGAGNDLINTITGNESDNVIDGGRGADTMIGGLGADTYIVDNARDKIIDTDASQDLAKSSVTYTLGSAVEWLELTGTKAINGTGNGNANLILGNAAANTLDGGSSFDSLDGGGGNDILRDFDGGDYMAGGSGADRFCFAATTATAIFGYAKDVVSDFSHADHDLIDVSKIDANSFVAGDQAFTYVGTAAFSNTAGEIRAALDGTDMIVTGDTNGDGNADFTITLKLVPQLESTDLVL